MKMIPLTQGKCAIVDDDDFERLCKFKWYAAKERGGFNARRWVVNASGRVEWLRMHREIMGNPVGMVVDHINHDKLDNQKSNLRICTNSQNGRNRSGCNKNSKSGIRGVSWHKASGNWTARIMVGGRMVSLGYFKDTESASEAYLKGNIKYFGEYGGAVVRGVKHGGGN